MKLNTLEEFSPWQDSFPDVLSHITKNRDHLNSFPRTEKLIKQRKGKDDCHSRLNRMSLNVSKINLHESPEDQISHNFIFQKSTRPFQGPRISFYSKMNPKNFLNDTFRNSSYRGRYDFPKPQLRKESSIHYLSILEDEPIEKQTELENLLRTLEERNEAKDSLFLTRKSKEEYQNMRRLKFLFKSRKNIAGREVK
jgi:hypothetical protein